MKNKMNIRDIATKANVSDATISRYLNGKYKSMSVETRKKIETIIEDTGYRPSNVARSLKLKKSNLIGLVIADIENPFYNVIIKSLNDHAKKLGYSILISVSNNSPELEVQQIQTFVDNGIEGLIINTVGGNDDFIDAISKIKPTVLLDRNISHNSIDIVTSNNTELMENALLYLKKNGYESIALFTQDITRSSVRAIRYEAFEQNTLFPKTQKQVYFIDTDNEEQTRKDFKHFISTYKKCAIISINGLVLLSVLRAILAENYEIGDDFGLVTFDNYIWNTLISSGITTIIQDVYRIGTTSLELLSEQINQNRKQPKHIVIKGEFVERGSTRKLMK